jgi:hypothetical protein
MDHVPKCKNKTKQQITPQTLTEVFVREKMGEVFWNLVVEF